MKDPIGCLLGRDKWKWHCGQWTFYCKAEKQHESEEFHIIPRMGVHALNMGFRGKGDYNVGIGRRDGRDSLALFHDRGADEHLREFVKIHPQRSF